MSGRRLTLQVRNENLRLSAPFRIAGYTFHESPITVVTLSDGEFSGVGEAAGVYYLGDNPAAMRETIESLRSALEAGITREELRELLPPGGARNALDCALWELEAAREGQPVWQLAAVKNPHPLLTTFTVSAKSPAEMAREAITYGQAKAIKVKLTGELEIDSERVRAVRAARPKVWLGVDANQGYERAMLERLLPVLIKEGVALLEQPCARGHENQLDGLEHVLPIAADESVQSLKELDAAAGRFDVVNIKLDKCGGLTEGLMIGERARSLGMKVMVGNMIGSSWAMAPAFVLGQQCDVVDLDGPIFLTSDRDPQVRYEEGLIHCEDDVWGATRPRTA